MPQGFANNWSKEYAPDHWTRKLLENYGVQEDIIAYVGLGIDILILLLLAWIADRIAKSFILRMVRAYVTRSKNEWDDLLLERKVFNNLAHLAPAFVVYELFPFFFQDFPEATGLLLQAVEIYAIVVVIMVANSFLNAVRDILFKTERFKDKPIGSYVQLGKIILYLFGGVYLISLILGVNPLSILAGMGAATAVMLLIFRDTILGLVASITISANDMVRIGDWVSFSKYGADGDVIEISLTTVKVQNWDATITTVPTYAFMSDAFKNWRNMQALGVRRIKRSLHFKMGTVKLVDGDMLERFKKIELVKDYIDVRQTEIDTFNKEHNIDRDTLINGRNMTNIGVFRHYAQAYLAQNPMVAKDQTMMVRQLEPTESGIPLEIYCFSTDTRWVYYEGIQADIMDHLMAAARYFDLEIFENPTGDFSVLKK
ncbi:mechanosensitive ion channel [Cryomorphaceae bacterium]|nr:mechanosensitive ion channel [Cryomorphaceae bacterium]